MNLYGILFFILVTAVFGLETLADLLNLKRLGDPLPEEFQSLLNSDKYQKSLNYQTDLTHFELFHRAFSFIVFITFILSGGYNFVDQFARSFQVNPILTGLIFLGTLLTARFLVQLPFSIYSIFIIESKYGFNKTNPRTFLLDTFKGLIISAILGSILFSAIVYFFESSGKFAWLYCWIAFSIFQILLSYLAPSLLLPLFNKFERLQEGELRREIEKYAQSRNFQLNGIFTMDSSKRSTKSNAFFTGFGNLRKLVLFDTLISKNSIQELVAILAHEIGHFEKKHIIKSMALSIISSGIIFYSISIFLRSPELPNIFRLEIPSIYANLIFIGLIYSPLLRIVSLLSQKISRKHEFEADQFAKDTYGNPEVLISALKNLSIDHLSHLTPHPLKVALDYSHPPILERIKALRR